MCQQDHTPGNCTDPAALPEYEWTPVVDQALLATLMTPAAIPRARFHMTNNGAPYLTDMVTVRDEMADILPEHVTRAATRKHIKHLVEMHRQAAMLYTANAVAAKFPEHVDDKVLAANKAIMGGALATIATPKTLLYLSCINWTWSPVRRLVDAHIIADCADAVSATRRRHIYRETAEALMAKDVEEVTLAQAFSLE